MTTIQNTSSSAAGAVRAALDPAPSTPAASDTTLPDPDTALALSGDPAAELAALMVKNGNNARKIEQSARDMQEQIAEREDDAEVDAMRRKASDTLNAGWAEGAGMMAQGACELGAATAEADSALPGSKGAQARATGTGWNAGGEMTNAAGTVVAAGYRASAANDDADAEAHRASAGRARTAAEDLHDEKRGADDLISAALDFYRDYVSSKATERAATLHRS